MTSTAGTASIASSVDNNVGFHFTHDTRLEWRRPVGCHTLHLDYTLPPDVFADPYELDLHSDRFAYTIDTHPDLERPLSAVDYRTTLLRLNVHLPSDVAGTAHVALPLHGRYGRPLNTKREEAYAVSYVSPPQALWQCGEGQHTYTIPISTTSPDQDVPFVIPVGLSGDLAFVQMGTALSVLAVFCYLASVFNKVHNRFIIRLYQSKEE